MMNMLLHKDGAAAGVIGGGIFKPQNLNPVVLTTAGDPHCAFSEPNGAPVASANHHERGEGSSHNDPQKPPEEPSEGLLSAGMLTEGLPIIPSQSPSLPESLLSHSGGGKGYQFPSETLEGRLPKACVSPTNDQPTSSFSNGHVHNTWPSTLCAPTQRGCHNIRQWWTTPTNTAIGRKPGKCRRMAPHARRKGGGSPHSPLTRGPNGFLRQISPLRRHKKNDSRPPRLAEDEGLAGRPARAVRDFDAADCPAIVGEGALRTPSAPLEEPHGAPPQHHQRNDPNPRRPRRESDTVRTAHLPKDQAVRGRRGKMRRRRKEKRVTPTQKGYPSEWPVTACGVHG
jgi:hypothetical protein